MAVSVNNHAKVDIKFSLLNNLLNSFESYLLRAYSRPILCFDNWTRLPSFVKMVQSFILTFFHKKLPFLANIECYPNFLEYAQGWRGRGGRGVVALKNLIGGLSQYMGVGAWGGLKRYWKIPVDELICW